MQFKFNGTKISDDYKKPEELGIEENGIIECSEATLTINMIAEDGEETVYNEVKKSSQMSEILNGKSRNGKETIYCVLF